VHSSIGHSPFGHSCLHIRPSGIRLRHSFLGTFSLSQKTAQFFTPAFFHFSRKINISSDFNFQKNP
jgi:hypothetical protein